jgi:hypothetical protein
VQTQTLGCFLQLDSSSRQQMRLVMYGLIWQHRCAHMVHAHYQDHMMQGINNQTIVAMTELSPS